MIYAADEEFAKDFIKRTRNNYEFIKKYHRDLAVTQLINSAIGLLVIPKEQHFDKIPQYLNDPDLYNKLCSCILINSYNEDHNMSSIVRHLRNGISHAHMDFNAEQPPSKNLPLEIHTVKITDTDNRKNAKFEIKLTIELLEEFLYAVSDVVINQGG